MTKINIEINKKDLKCINLALLMYLKLNYDFYDNYVIKKDIKGIISTLKEINSTKKVLSKLEKNNELFKEEGNEET